jgi:peptidyl-tRNA hydrolase
MIKQVILVPTYLGMSVGKIASQCCHVARPMYMDDNIEKRAILKVDSQRHLEALRRLKDSLNRCWVYDNLAEVEWYEFVDSAPTTEGTAGLTTAISVIGEEAAVDCITGHLELL